MYLANTLISCGIKQLVSIGDNPGQEDFDQIMLSIKENYGNYACSIIIASLAAQQAAAHQFLLMNGFVQIGEPVLNCNSGNNILLFIKTIDVAIVKKLIENNAIQQHFIDAGYEGTVEQIERLQRFGHM